ncbi:MerR family transcriptional regulator [Streptomyces diastaticus]|uniref:MerR family transcriptional regulator n=1 Tax=Streptomyces diastaticus subsp. diastaticus TaxID=68040 RepID=A0ABQ1CSD0_STRDI|nr:MerR family transcriptional regulator [Streptomyces diastaticus]GFH73040.1 MerR family transcriptional regulator [Streptomyces diastaticus subsp. diastaticus]GGU25533.1 MerR family transcriptional regulator [Streptomyces diastaticus subsp. diastaticus]
MDETFTIGQLARLTGLSVRTLRYWSDEGAIPPVARSVSGYRLYDPLSVARAELVRALRELGLGLDDVCGVLSGRSTVAEVAEAHVHAVDAQIRALRTSRAVLSAVAERGASAEEATLLNRLARLSGAERERVIEEFKEEVFGDLDDPGLRERMHAYTVELPDDPTPDQLAAWIELAELVGDSGFRARLRTWTELNTPVPGRGRPPGACVWWARQVVHTVAEARDRGTSPREPAARDLLTSLFPDTDWPAVLRSVEAGLAAEAERYRGLRARVRGLRTSPDATGELEWLAEALRSALRAR